MGAKESGGETKSKEIALVKEQAVQRKRNETDREMGEHRTG